MESPAAGRDPLRLEWIDEDNGRIGDVPFRLVRSGYDEARTTGEEIVVLKGRSFFKTYESLFPEPPRSVLEVGIFEGGSALIFAAMWRHTRVVGIDLRPSSPAVLSHIERLGLGDRVELHYRVGQNDKAKISAILDRNPSDFDLIVDDASHRYEPSRRTFEITYPRLAPGGAYVLEDWGWAHWQSWRMFKQYEGQSALSNLVWELTMAAATSPGIVGSVTSTSQMAVVRKPAACGPLPADFSLSGIYTARGKNLETLI